MNYSYIVVEGPHDAAFVARLLTLAGCKLVRPKTQLDPYWHPLIPEKFPVDDDIVERVRIPHFYQNQQHSIAVHAAGSDSKIVATLEESLSALALKNSPLSSLSAIGAIIDADHSPATRFANLRADLLKIPIIANHFPNWPTEPGRIGNSPRTGIFVMPDNQTEGTLESLLLDAASTTWPKILQQATTYVNAAKENLAPAERNEIDRPAGPNKAIAASISNLLRPGYAIQNSIKDDNWLTPATLALPRIAALQTFLHHLTAL